MRRTLSRVTGSFVVRIGTIINSRNLSNPSKIFINQEALSIFRYISIKREYCYTSKKQAEWQQQVRNYTPECSKIVSTISRLSAFESCFLILFNKQMITLLTRVLNLIRFLTA